MREIKFRAWNTFIKKIIEAKTIIDGKVVMPDGEEYDFPLMQFTGLHDKNGVEIYEGDYLDHPKHGKQEVVYKYGGFGIDIKGIGVFTDGFDSFSNVSADVDNCVVISNIYENEYENPELLANLQKLKV